jgi:hypothetical protein
VPKAPQIDIFVDGKPTKVEDVYLAVTEKFNEDHPEFYASEGNKAQMLDYIQRRDLGWTSRNLESAYRALKAQGALAADPDSPEEKARVKKLREEQRTANLKEMWEQQPPIYSRHGQRLDTFEGFVETQTKRKPTRQSDAGRNTGAVEPIAVSADLPAHPTKREFAAWSADKVREWLDTYGWAGRDLPEYLR